jgi:hypothetical protein
VEQVFRLGRSAPTSRVWRAAAALVLAVALGGCDARKFEGGGALRAQRIVLERAVLGLRETLARMEQGEPVLAEDDVAIAIDETPLRNLVRSQLPFETVAGKFRIVLKHADVGFTGAPTIKLRGAVTREGVVDIEAAVEVIGTIAKIEIDPETSTLRATISVDHLQLEKAAGIESLLSGATMDELARALRLGISGKLPVINIPVRIEREVDLPAVTEGPVRVAGARMAIDASVDRIFAGRGRLWIGIRLKPGDLVKTTEAPEAKDLTAEEVGASFGANDKATRTPESTKKEGPPP